MLHRHLGSCTEILAEIQNRSTGSEHVRNILSVCVCFIAAGPITKLFAWGGEESGGHVL